MRLGACYAAVLPATKRAIVWRRTDNRILGAGTARPKRGGMSLIGP
jgi:hypothetical protein